MIKRIKEWMHWRGVTVKDLAYGAFALGALCTLSTILIYAVALSLLS